MKGRSSLSESQVQALLDKDLARFHDVPRSRITAPVTQSMVDAIIIQTFNTGTDTDTSKKVAALINQRQYGKAELAMYEAPKTSKGVTVSGLVERRKFEVRLFGKEGHPVVVNTENIKQHYPDYSMYPVTPTVITRPLSVPPWVVPMLAASSCILGLMAALRIKRNLKRRR